MSKTYYMRSTEGHVFTTSNPEYHKTDKRLTVAAGKVALKSQCAEKLRSMIKPGDTIYCVIRHVSRSGMVRHISLHAIVDGEMRRLDYLASVVIEWRESAHGGLIVNGCGMDMAFHTVYTLGRCLWPNGTPEPHGSRNGAPDNDGGYALKSSIL